MACFSFLPFLLFLFFFSPLLVLGRDSFARATAFAGEGEHPQLDAYIVHVLPPEDTTLADDENRESYYKSFLPPSTVSSTESRMMYMYHIVASGFTAKLSKQELEEMSKKKGFIAAFPNKKYAKHTTHSPQFLGLNQQKELWGVGNFGEGVIIGVLDGGIFPTHPSFNDAGMPPPPSKWKGRCDFNVSLCNNKVIGARSFVNGSVGAFPIDGDGHGTHTASTAAGAIVAGAEVLGNARGVATGMAPKAHLAIYKVCDNDDCLEADILAAIETAISDGVDVLSMSIGGDPAPFFQDRLIVGTFKAIDKGVFVSCSGGNSGPNYGSVTNGAPWILTVAASTMDRSIRATVRLGNGKEINGESVFQPPQRNAAFYPLVYAGASGKPNASFCGDGAFDGIDIKGKIVLCDRGNNISRIHKGEVVRAAGGFGMILMNQAADAYSTNADAHVLPASHVAFANGAKIKAYINSSSYPTASFIFKGTLLGTTPAPAIASFSSRGPNLASRGILKPDITGPGVNVLAAWPFDVGPDASPSNSTAVTFNIVSGTSMSAPHLSGIAALLKAAHPDWSPAAIKSAIMTTADIKDHSDHPIVDERLLAADLFAIGAGHVNPTRASDPGLIYDLTTDDYIPYLCGLGYTNEEVGIITSRRINCGKVKAILEGELNYPSISVLFGSKETSVSFERTVKNVGEARSYYSAEVDMPTGVEVCVEPTRLEFSEMNEEKKFKVTFTRKNGEFVESNLQGYLNWVSKKRTVRSPISVAFSVN